MEPVLFDTIYKEYYPRIRRYMNRMVGETNASDLTQEVFLRAFKSFETFEGRSSISTWLYKIASNLAIDSYRSVAARNQKSESSLPPEEEQGFASLMARTPASPVDEDMLTCVREFVDSLPENYRAAFVLHELEGHSNVEVAGILGITVSTAKIRIHRGKARLKEKMKNGCCLYYDEENRLACNRRENAP